MTDTPSKALRDLRDTLRTESSSIELLISTLSACLDVLSGSGSGSVEITRKGIQRYLPSIQIQLLTHTIPNYLHALDDTQVEVIHAFFAPRQSTTSTADRSSIFIHRGIALTSYLTLPGLLNANPVPQLPVPSRSFLLDILDRLSTGYSIDEVYWAVWSTSGQGEAGSSEEKGGNENGRGAQQLLWEEATRSVVRTPAKCANAVGKWKTEAWVGEVPDGLVSK
jgi:telomere length regulation protein